MLIIKAKILLLLVMVNIGTVVLNDIHSIGIGTMKSTNKQVIQ